MTEHPPTDGSPAAAAPSSIDRVGAGVGIACAVHCVGTPALLAYAPLAGLSWLANDAVELAVVGIAAVLGLISARALAKSAERTAAPNRTRALALAMVGAVAVLLIVRFAVGDALIADRATIGAAVALASLHTFAALDRRRAIAHVHAPDAAGECDCGRAPQVHVSKQPITAASSVVERPATSA